MKQKIENLVSAINNLIDLDKPGVDDEMLYDVVFKTHTETIRPMMVDLRMSFDYYDPDTSYREDVDAYLNALKDFKKRLETLL